MTYEVYINILMHRQYTYCLLDPIYIICALLSLIKPLSVFHQIDTAWYLFDASVSCEAHVPHQISQ